MRSLIILEVEHGEDTDGIEMFTAHLANHTQDSGIDVIDWTVSTGGFQPLKNDVMKFTLK